MTNERERSSKSEAIGTFLYWASASAFLWALIGPFGLRHAVGWSKPLAFGFYPAACVLAAIILLTRRRRNLALAMLNLICGAGWILYAYWVVEAFKAGFAK